MSSLKRSIISRLRPLRLRIAPPGGRREKVLKLVYQGVKVWKNEGLASAYRKGVQTLSGWLTRRSASRVDLHALSNKQLVPSRYDIILLTDPNRQDRSQTLQELARCFAADGHRVFSISPKVRQGASIKVRPMEEGIFEVQLAGTKTIQLSSEAVSKQVTDSILGNFAALRNELDIVDAICILELPFWKSLAFSLRDKFGWRIIYDYSGDQSTHPLDRIFPEELTRKGDLILVSPQPRIVELEKQDSNDLLVADPEAAGDCYAQLKQKMPGLFPKASIVIVTFNNLEYTRLCLNSIYEKTIYPNFEVIIVDNASMDGTPEYLRSFEAGHKNIRVIYNSRNEGFARANNLGMASASGDAIVLLNNDTVVTRVWLSRLLNYLRDPEVGLVGSVSNGVSNEAQVEMPFTDLTALDAFATQRAKERSDRLTPIKMLAMYCIAGRRDVFQRIGPLDEQFGIGMFEDDDYSLRARRAGYRIAVAEDVFIHHFGRSGFKLLGDERYFSLFEENRKKFESKWNIKWQQHLSGALAENRQFTADLQSILDHYPETPGVIIFPPTIGWNISLFQRPHQLARAFAKKGFLIFFCTDALIDKTKGFRQVSPGLYLANVSWGVFDLVDRPVVLTLPYNREYLFQLRQPIVVYEVIDDLDVFPYDQTQLQKNHDVLLKESDLVLVTADRLMEQVKQTRTDAILCPNAVELEHFAGAGRPGPMPPDLAPILKADRPVIGYYGALARWFDYDLVRQAAQSRPDWEFLLIGPNHDNTLMESDLLSVPNVHWLGSREYWQLPDYLRYFSVATIPFLVNKITVATSPIKLFEYMAAGKPIVTSDLPECRKYPGVFVARHAKEYINLLEHALTLIHDPAYVQGLYQTAQENTWEARVDQIIDSLEIHGHPKSLPLEL